MKRATGTLTKRNGHAEPVAAEATRRVAIYTRKSVSEGLDQAFNSLDAQREAVEACVQSHRHEGWAALPESYDDGGFSGANTDRPAFQRLLADIEAGLVDVVAVYRLDRLSRSLLDFAQLMRLFEEHGVAFVSVTEQFDTSTPMGRMVLNLLAIFAQFERETIAQRTKDKILATRRRGQWTGGRPVLGYDVVEKKLVVNEPEAEQVRETHALYEELGSLLAVVEELKRRGWETKTWTNQDGKTTRGRPFSKTSLHTLLTNPLYAGRIRAGDEVVDAEHEAIVEPEIWERTQRLLETRRGPGAQHARGRGSRTLLLQGLVRCACGAGMVPSHTTKGEKRYSYYVCQRAQKEGAASCPGSRVASGDLEAFVVEQLRQLGRDPDVLAATLEADRADREARRPELVTEARKVSAARATLQIERENLLEAIATSKSSSATPVLVRRMEETDESLAEANRRAGELADEVRALEMGQVDAEELHHALADLEPVWAELYPQEQARLLDLLIERVEFDAAEGEVAITFRPGGPERLGR